MITFSIAIVTLILGFVIGWNIAGFIAYDDGIYDEKKHWYMHAHNWGRCAEKYKDEGYSKQDATIRIRKSKQIE